MRLDPIGTLFGNAWKRLRERFTVVAPIFLVPLILIGIGRLLLIRQTVAALALGGIINLLGTIVSIIASIAIISAFGKNTDFAASCKTGITLFWAWIWIVILTVLAIIGGSVMLIIPGIMLMIQLAFTNYVFVLEGKRGMAALAGSREYIKGYWWAYVGRALLLLLCLLAALLILYAPASLIFGQIVGGIVYGAILLVYAPFSIAYVYEIYENLRRLKPDAPAAAVKADGGFLKVSVVVGIIGAVVLAGLLFVVLSFIKPCAAGVGCFLGDPSLMAPLQISPTSGPVGTEVMIGGPTTSFDSTNTILMNGLVASRDVSIGNLPGQVGHAFLSFIIPQSLAPDCSGSHICPQFLLSVTPNDYVVTVKNSKGTISAGTFTVTPVKLQ